jgi:hypothetical protein
VKIHVETPGGETIASGEIKITSDAVATYATLYLDDPISGRAYTEVCGPLSEYVALTSLASALEKIAKRIREKAGE